MKKKTKKKKNKKEWDVKDITQLGKFTCSAFAMRKIADWIEKKVGHDGDVEIDVSIYEYEHLKTLGYNFSGEINEQDI